METQACEKPADSLSSLRYNASALNLPDGEVHVWITEVMPGEPVPHAEVYESWLSSEERERYRRFVFDRDRRLFLGSRAQLRGVLSLYAPAIQPASWLFRRNRFGRPAIDNPLSGLPLCFNLSHCPGLAVIAISRIPELGIDVENIDRAIEAMGIAESHFTPSEIADLRACRQEDRARRFFDYWTLKEAYSKARGLGLSLPFHEFEFRFDDSGQPLLSRDHANAVGDFAPCRLVQFEPAQAYLGALAVGSSFPVDVIYRRLNL